MGDGKAVLSRIGNRLYRGWDQDIYVIQNFPDDVPFHKMETLNTPQRWALLQACVVGLVEKVGGEVKAVPNTKIEVGILNLRKILLQFPVVWLY